MKSKYLVLLAAGILTISDARASGSDYVCKGETRPPSTLTLSFLNPNASTEVGLIINGITIGADNRDGNGYLYDVLNLGGRHFLMRVCPPTLKDGFFDLWMCVSYWCK